LLTLSVQDRDRISLLRQVAEGHLAPWQAAERMGLTPRQFRRIRRSWERKGDEAVIHGARGQPSNRRVDAAVRARALEMAGNPMFEDFGPTLLSEHLARDDRGGIVHPSTLRLWLIQEGLWQPNPRRRKHRRRRPRRRARGEMVLMDSSEHDWLEGRGEEEMTLIAMMDDATSELFAFFYPRDTGLANRKVLAAYLQKHGRMGALYVDRAGHFGNWRKTSGAKKADEDAEPVMVKSIIRQGVSALEIELILALSPQAKGRVERLFGTLQDRLIKEMRVAGISTMADANRFLQEVFIPFWNQRFTVAPAEESDAHRPLPPEVNLNALFAETVSRSLREDFTFRNKGIFWQISKEEAPDSGSKKQKVVVERWLDGSTHYRCADRYVHPEPFISPVLEPVEPAKPRTTTPRPKPAADHPWRRSSFGSRTKSRLQDAPGTTMVAGPDP
jgi:hypothetical protein